MKTVLFVCTGNTCRSPMAQGIFNKIAKQKNLDWVAKSAGLQTVTGMPYTENAVKACECIDVHIKNGKSLSINEVDFSEINLFCPMTLSHANMLVSMGVNKEKIMLLSSKGISDPYGQNLEIYKNCCLEINSAVINLINKL